MRDMVRCVVFHAVPYIRKSLCLENTQGSLKSGMTGSVPTVKHRGGSVMVWAAVLWYSTLLVPLLPFMAELLEGSTWAGWVIRCIHPMIQTLFPSNDAVFQDDNAPFTQLELFSHCLKSMKVNLNIFPG
jgi:hypothetical protein